MNQRDLLIIGGGPAGAAAAIVAARAGVRVTLFEKGPHGRDKVCGDGLTPRAVGALEELKIDIGDSHRIDGLRMIAGKQRRELDWPTTGRFPSHGAVWPRRRFDTRLMEAAMEAGAEFRFGVDALPAQQGAGAFGNLYPVLLDVVCDRPAGMDEGLSAAVLRAGDGGGPGPG